MTRILILLCVFSVACNRPDAPDCLQSAGEPTVEQRVTAPFQRLELRDYLFYEFYPGQDTYIELEGPENLLPDIVTEVNNGTLLVRNENTCNFVRSFKNRITVRFFGHLPTEVDNYATGDILCADSLRADKLVWNNRHAAGNVVLLTAVDSLSVQCHTGMAHVTVTGRARELELYNRGMGVLDARNCPSEVTYVNNSSINDVYAHPLGYFYVLITEKGNVYYTGQPSFIDRAGNGAGSIIEMP
jgi:hypothetical protein